MAGMERCRSGSRTPSPSRSTGPATSPYKASVSEDSDDYEHVSNAQGSATSTAIPHSTGYEGLRERNRTPYSVASPSAVPKREDAMPSSPTPDQTASSTSIPADKGKQKAEEDPECQVADTSENPFACHICLEVPAADDAVLSKCGHLFCWSDLSAWLDSNPPSSSQCPVCKSQIKDIQEDVIPIYSGGGSSSKKQIDPRTKPRPKPRVTPAPPQTAASRLGNFFGGGMPGPFGPATLVEPAGWAVQAGVFPFPGLSMSWSSGARPIHLAGPRGMTMGTYAGLPPGAPMTPEMQEAARRQQRNALIAFVVMIILFSLLATLGEMDMD